MNLYKYVCPFFLIGILVGCQSGIAEQGIIHHEVGEAQNELQYEDHYIVNLTYPKVNIETVDTEIQKVLGIYKEAYLQKVSSYREEEKAELNISYQSYQKESRYLSIKLNVFEHLLDTHEEVRTINYDQKSEQFIHIDDILEKGGLAQVSKLAKAHFLVNAPDECNSNQFKIAIAPVKNNFDTFVLRKDAIVFYFPSGTLFDYATSFEITYDKLADFTNLSQEEATVFVPYDDVLNEPVKNIDPNKPMVALTFDDGPTRKYTGAILDALQEHQASATFFILGSRANNAPDLLQRMVLEGNEIGNHTFSHKQLTTLSKVSIEEEINQTQEFIHNITNKYPNIIRPPYGSKNDAVMQCAQGKKLVTWTIDTQDWKHRNAETIVNMVINDIEDGDIILMHDLYASSAEAAIIMIPKLQDMGFQLVTVSELYAYGKNEAGKIM